MKRTKVRFGEVIADIYYNEKFNNKKLIIFCPGLPGRQEYDSFAQKFVSEGFAFLHLKYIGSWESDGVFSIINCVKTIMEAIIVARKGMKDIFNNDISLDLEEIFLLGHSFGGSLALVAGSTEKIDGIISLAPIVDYRIYNSHGSLNGENLEDLFNYLQKGFKNIFRGLTREEWTSFCKTGNKVNPVDYIDLLKQKKIFLAHGKQDKSVNFLETRDFFEKLNEGGNNATYFESSNGDHSNIREKSFKKIVSWIFNQKRINL